MKKEIIYLVLGVLIVTLGTILFSNFNKYRKTTNEYYVESREKLDRLKGMLVNYDTFSDSSFEYDENEIKIRIDDKYDVYIKNDSYLMKIKDIKNEDVYCDIVDAIATNLGNTKGSTIDTCKLSLSGIINMSGITVEFEGNNKLLKVSSLEAPALYNIDNTYSKGDIIPLEEINYNVKIDDFLFTSISVKDENEFKLCGNVYSSKNEDKFTFRAYDSNKIEVDTKEYLYDNNTNKYMEFCIFFDNSKSNIKYYSLNN